MNSLLITLSVLAALPTDEPLASRTWRPVVCYAARAPIERIRCGRPDLDAPGLQAVSVDQAGDVALVRFDGGLPRAEVLYRHGCELTAIAFGDLDPTHPGEEVYVGGYARGTGREGEGGAVVQLTAAGDAMRVWTGPAYVHSLEVVPRSAPGDPARLLACTYDGAVLVLARRADGAGWDERLLHREVLESDPEAVKAKDAAFLVDPTGAPPHEVLIAYKTGRTVYLDLDRPTEARRVHDEPGGLSRVTPDDDGGAYVTGYAGRVLHFVREGADWRVDVIDQEGADSGLRGLVRGTFPLPGGTAHLAIFGFHKRCRLLVPHQGVLDPYTIFVDVERGHAFEAGDLVPGNGADELLLGGYSERVTMLVAE